MGASDSNPAPGSDTSAARPPQPGSPGTTSGKTGAYHQWRERHIYAKRTRTQAWRVVVGSAGSVLVVLGLVLIPFPGPGWVIVFIGLGVLATEFAWAQRLLDFARDKVRAWTEWANTQSRLIRLLIGLLVLCLAACMLIVSLRLAGSPHWVPDWVPLVD